MKALTVGLMVICLVASMAIVSLPAQAQETETPTLTVTYTATETYTPTITETPTVTPTLTPGWNYGVELPSGAIGAVKAELTAGDLMISALLVMSTGIQIATLCLWRRKTMDELTWQFVVMLAAPTLAMIAGLISIDLAGVAFSFAKGLIFGR